MKPEFRAQAGAAGWAVSNPSIFAAAPLVASLALFQEAGVERLREKSLELTGYLEFLLDRLGSDGAAHHAAQPRGARLPAFVPHRRRRVAAPRCSAGSTANGVACDWREPDVIRASPIPLYNRFEDVFRVRRKAEAGAGERALT